MEVLKALLYCPKGRPYLIHESGDYDYNDMCCSYDNFCTVNRQYFYDEGLSLEEALNGKIVAECDYDIEKIKFNHIYERDDSGRLHNEWWWEYRGLNIGNYKCELAKESCLDSDAIMDYLGNKDGKAIHIKNLHIFDEPKELSDYCKFDEDGALIPITKAPQNMMNAVEHLGEPMYVENHYIGLDDYFENYVLISIRPELMCKILNGECTTIVKKKILRGML